MSTNYEAFDPVRALVAYHDALNSHDVERVSAFLSEGARYRSKGLGDVVGRAAILAALARYFDLHPDHRAWDEEITGAGPNAVRARWRLTATNRQTGIAIGRSGIETLTFDADGRIALIEAIDD